MPRAHLRTAAAVACAIFAAIAAESCSLFVDLDELTGGSSDASAADVTDASADASTDAPLVVTDSGTDASECIPKRRQNAHLVAEDGGIDDAIYVTLPSATLAGDFIVVGINFDYDCTAVSAVNDSAGNTYHQLVPYDSNGSALALETWGAENISANAADTVTVAFATSCEGRNIKVVEYTDVERDAAVDGVVSQHGDGGVMPNAIITTTSPTIVFAHTADQSHDLGAADGWTQIFIDEWATIAEEESFVSPTTVTVTAKPNDDDDWVIQGVALKACRAN